MKLIDPGEWIQMVQITSTVRGESGGHLSFLFPLWLRITAKATSFSAHVFVTRIDPCLSTYFESLNVNRKLREPGTPIWRIWHCPDGITDVWFGFRTTQKTGPVVPAETSPHRSWSRPPVTVPPCSSGQPGRCLGQHPLAEWLSVERLHWKPVTGTWTPYAPYMHFLILQMVDVFLLHSPLRITAPRSSYTSLHNADRTGIFSKGRQQRETCLSLLPIMKGCVSSCGHCRDHKVRCSVSSKNTDYNTGSDG